MGDMGDVFRAMRDDSKERRASNRKNGAQMLLDAGITFLEKSDGEHLIIETESQVIDLWPGTGKWTVRGSNKYQRGVRSLIKSVWTKQPPSDPERKI